MQTWMDHFDESFCPYLDIGKMIFFSQFHSRLPVLTDICNVTVGTGPYDHWLQLKGDNVSFDEMKRGSIKTPLSSTFLFALVDDDGFTSHSVIVTFHIVENGNGLCRPWRLAAVSSPSVFERLSNSLKRFIQLQDGSPPRPEVALPHCPKATTPPQTSRSSTPVSRGHSRRLPPPERSARHNPLVRLGNALLAFALS